MTYISAVATAKLIRKALKSFKADYPEVKFSVNKEGRIQWVDGPTQNEVKAIAGKFHGATFDGMQDLETSFSQIDENGNTVHYGIKYLSFNRDYSVDFLEWAIEKSDIHAYRSSVDAYQNGERVDPQYTIKEPSKWSGASIKPADRYYATANTNKWYDEWQNQVMNWAAENSKTHDHDAIEKAEREAWDAQYEAECKAEEFIKEIVEETNTYEDMLRAAGWIN